MRNEEVQPVSIRLGVEVVGVGTSFLFSDKGIQESQTVMSGDTTLGTKTKESLQKEGCRLS